MHGFNDDVEMHKQLRHGSKMEGNDTLEAEGDGKRHLLASNRSGRETEQPEGLLPPALAPGGGGAASKSRNTDELETAQSMQQRQKKSVSINPEPQLTEGANVVQDTAGNSTEKSFRLGEALERGELCDTISVKSPKRA